ncbi:MAG: hypothetical protein EOP85_04735, partial [Verrucomicrobiaceae bacterium]
MASSVIPSFLAPLQQVMLRDSLAAPHGGDHVEQVEIRFSAGVEADDILRAWNETVAGTDALRVSFLIEDGVSASLVSAIPEAVRVEEGSREGWLEEDRCRPMLASGQVPWRAVLWPVDRYFVWTFHHALLDGRSITRIVRAFLDRVDGKPAENSALSRWLPPDDGMKLRGDQLLRGTFFREVTGSSIRTDEVADHGPAVRCLGQDFLSRLGDLADAREVTTGTLLIWAWGQAVAEVSGRDAAIVEQVRAGVRQEGTAGFTMGLLPLRVDRGGMDSLPGLRHQMLGLRDIEAMGREDFTPGVFPDVDGPWSSVIMIEQGTLAHLAG